MLESQGPRRDTHVGFAALARPRSCPAGSRHPAAPSTRALVSGESGQAGYSARNDPGPQTEAGAGVLGAVVSAAEQALV